MAVIPLKQLATITPASKDTDKFNRPVMGVPYALKCRLEESAKLVRTNTQGFVGSAEVVSACRFYFDKLAPVKMGDSISFTDELGNTRTFQPLSIEVKRGINGKALVTVVHV